MNADKPIIDYSAILADLEAKKTAIEALISYVKIAQTATIPGIGEISQVGTSVFANTGSVIQPGDVPAGAFHGKSVPEAIRAYLDMVKKKQTIPEVTDALKRGGIESTSNSFHVIVRNALIRAEGKDFLRSGNAWGLADWWPAAMRNAKAKTKNSRPNKKKPKSKKSAETSKPSRFPINVTKGASVDSGGMTAKILPLLKMGLTPDEIATKINSHPKVVKMLLGSLAKKQMILKDAEGRYLVNSMPS